jgi:hypothetical protein
MPAGNSRVTHTGWSAAPESRMERARGAMVHGGRYATHTAIGILADARPAYGPLERMRDEV